MGKSLWFYDKVLPGRTPRSYPLIQKFFRNLVLGELAGTQNLSAEGLQTEREPSGVLVQQNTGNLKFLLGLFLLQIRQKLLRHGAVAVGDKDHIRLLKTLLLYEPQSLLQRCSGLW